MKVLVAFGGESPEREISISSGKAVLAALREGGHDAIPADINEAKEVLLFLEREIPDVVFPCFHGDWGEDGRIQALLDLLGFPYTCSGPEACALAMDKEASKAVFSCHCGIRTPSGIALDAGDVDMLYEQPEMLHLLREGKKLVVKPTSCGSTVGVSIISSMDDLLAATRAAARYGQRILVEEYIEGRELTVAVWGGGAEPIAFPVIEIEPQGGFYSYEAKYTPGRSRYVVPASLEDRISEEVRSAAIRAHLALGCRIYSRVDIRLGIDDNPYVLEVNTIPGMTSTSLVPKAARAYGWSFPELTSRMVEAALNVDPSSSRRGIVSFGTNILDSQPSDSSGDPDHHFFPDNRSYQGLSYGTRRGDAI